MDFRLKIGLPILTFWLCPMFFAGCAIELFDHQKKPQESSQMTIQLGPSPTPTLTPPIEPLTSHGPIDGVWMIRRIQCETDNSHPDLIHIPERTRFSISNETGMLMHHFNFIGFIGTERILMGDLAFLNLSIGYLENQQVAFSRSHIFPIPSIEPTSDPHRIRSIFDLWFPENRRQVFQYNLQNNFLTITSINPICAERLTHELRPLVTFLIPHSRDHRAEYPRPEIRLD